MKLLLGIEGSDESQRALRKTVERAREAGDELTVAILQKETDEQRSREEIESSVREVLAEFDVDADIIQVEGDPGGRLLELAEGEEYDRLVIGGGEASPMGKIQLGPITEFVLLNAQTTVTLVR